MKIHNLNTRKNRIISFFILVNLLNMSSYFGTFLILFQTFFYLLYELYKTNAKIPVKFYAPLVFAVCTGYHGGFKLIYPVSTKLVNLFVNKSHESQIFITVIVCFFITFLAALFFIRLIHYLTTKFKT